MHESQNTVEESVYLSLPLFLAPVRRPVLRAAMRPTLRPAEVSRRTVDAIPARGGMGMSVREIRRKKRGKR